MAKKFHQPLRMCVSCRARDAQSKMLRLQCTDGSLERFKGYGRSFYLCNECILSEKKVTKALMRECKSPDRDRLINKLKEIITDDRKS
ncbi:DUF448 domain-containing protein [Sulfurimonas hongkongensis]|nr:DUF448 domain-containing protein [Sulfurimonas hongkongensis]